MHQVQKELLKFGFYKELEIVINPFRMIAWHPRSNETCFWVSSRHRCLLRDLRRMSIHFLWEDPDTFFNGEKKSGDINSNDLQKIQDSTWVACKLRILRDEMRENARFLKFGMQLNLTSSLSDVCRMTTSSLRLCDPATRPPFASIASCNSPPLIRRPATLLPWSPPKFIDAPLTLARYYSISPPKFTATPHQILTPSHARTPLEVLPPSSTCNFFGGLKPHTKVQPPQQQKKEKGETLVLLLLESWLCPKFLIFLPPKLRPWTSRPIEIWGRRGSVWE